MDPYLELFFLRKHNPKQFLKLFGICILQHVLLIYTMYLLSLVHAPVMIVLAAMYGEMFISLYLTQNLHYEWQKRVFIEESDDESEVEEVEEEREQRSQDIVEEQGSLGGEQEEGEGQGASKKEDSVGQSPPDLWQD
jgi:hypothetical protein